MKSQGFHPSAGAHWRLPAAGWGSLHGKTGSCSRKTPTSCRLFLGREHEKPRFSSFRWCSLAASCRRVGLASRKDRFLFTENDDILSPGGSDVVIAEVRGSQLAKRAVGPVASAPGFQCASVLTSSGVPMPTSELRKRAKPGGRTARAVNEGPEGLSERLASGRGHPRAAGCWLHGKHRQPTAARHGPAADLHWATPTAFTKEPADVSPPRRPRHRHCCQPRHRR